LDGPRVFQTDPTGIYFQFRATVIGEGEVEITEILEKEYKPSITIEAGLKLAMRALSKVLDKNFSIERIDAACIRTSTKHFEAIPKATLEKVAKEVKKK